MWDLATKHVLFQMDSVKAAITGIRWSAGSEQPMDL